MTAGLGPVLAVLSALVSVPLLVHAADPPASAGGDEIEEIVVTAEKRASTVEHTPIAITAVTGKELSDRDRKSVV